MNGHYPIALQFSGGIFQISAFAVKAKQKFYIHENL